MKLQACKRCGQLFEPHVRTGGKQLYCSEECRKYYKQKKSKRDKQGAIILPNGLEYRDDVMGAVALRDPMTRGTRDRWG